MLSAILSVKRNSMARLVVQLDAVIVSLKVRAFIFIVFLKMKNVNPSGYKGGYRIFQKGGGVETHDTNYGGRGEGVLSASGPIRKAGGAGAVRFRSDTKRRKVGGGCCLLKARYEKREGGGVCCPAALQARYKKRGGGRATY